VNSVLNIFFLLGCLNCFGYSSGFADSLQREASAKGGEEGLDFMLDNYYAVFNKNYEDGIEWASLAKSLAIKNGFELQEGRANLALGTVHYLHGDYELCIEHYHLARDIFEDLNNPQYLGRTYNEMSVYARKQGLYDLGLEYTSNAFKYCSECEDYECVETSYNNQGVIFEFQEKYDLAQQSYHMAMNIALENKNEVGLSYIYNNLAELSRIREEYDSMSFYIFKSLEIRSRLHDYQGVGINYTNLGEMYMLTNQFDLAEINFLKSLAIAKEVSYTDLQRHNLQMLFELNKSKGKLEEAIMYYEQSILLKDSLLNSDKIRSLSEMEVRYETEKVKTDFLEEQEIRSKTELKLSNRNSWIIAIVSFALLAILIGLLLYQRKKKNAEKEKQLAILAEKEKGLIAVFDATEEERQRISKDLHDSVGQQLSGLKMAWSRMSHDSDYSDDQRAFLNKMTVILDETADEVREISHQMMPRVLVELGLVPAIQEMLDKSLKLTPLNYEFEDFGIDGRFEERIEVSLYRISQELVNNVIKHSKATHLSVQLFKNQGFLILIVEDNGTGIDDNNSSGHGMMNIKSRLNTINGDVNFEAGHENGTIATIRINLNR